MNPGALRRLFRLPARWDLPVTEGIVILAVAVPTAALLFAMNRALEGERDRLLRDRQSSRQVALEDARRSVQSALTTRLALPDSPAQPGPMFLSIMEKQHAAGCAVLDAAGSVVFPVLTIDRVTEETTRADELLDEFSLQRVSEGRAPHGPALHALARSFERGKLRRAADSTDRLHRVMILLGLLDVTPREEAAFAAAAAELKALAADYTAPLPSAQRLLIHHELHRLGDPVTLPHADAEALSLRLSGMLKPPAVPDTLTPAAGDAAFLQIQPAGANAVLFFHRDTLLLALEKAAATALAGSGMDVTLAPHHATHQRGEPLAVITAGRSLPGYELAAFGPDDTQAIAGRIEQLKSHYRWSAVGGSLFIGLLAAWAIRRFARRARDTQVKQDFLSTVSHELRTPLTSIRMFTDTLAAGGLADEERARTYLDFISRENERLSRLVDNFLTFSRLESGRLSYDFQPLHPDEAADAAREAVQSRMEVPGCEFTATSEPGLPLVRADLTSLTTALVNLLDNAAKYTRDDKRIIFSVTRESTDVVFAVTDNGPGMDAETVRRLGEKFYRAKDATDRRGFGLGLSIVRSIVNAHGGKLHITSTPGSGSRFAIHLPALPDTP